MKSIDEEIKINDQLNPALWENNELKEDVKERLLDIVDNFLDGLKEDKIKIDVVDVRLLGSNANYNYTDKSDIDLHIVADISSTPCEQNVMPQLYNAYRSLFSKAYDIKINGYDVELYVEDVNQPAKSNGVYSLYTGWIKEPTKSEIPQIDWEQFELVFDGMEDRYFDIVGEHLGANVNEDKKEIILYRGEGAKTKIPSNLSKLAGKFYALDKLDCRYYAKDDNHIYTYKLDDNAKIKKARVSTEVGNTEWCTKKYKELEELTSNIESEYWEDIIVDSIQELVELGEEDNYFYENTFEFYNVYNWVNQVVNRIELEKQGYDGIFYKEEDGVPQYQIWNDKVVHKIDNINEDLDYDGETNSEGNPLTPEQVEFFKDSKIRDNNGKLLVCHHGSPIKNIKIFKVVDNEGKPTAFFTASKSYANEYSHNWDSDEDGELYDVYLNIERPFDIEDNKCKEIAKEILGKEVNTRTIVDTDILFKELRNNPKYNYDGIIAGEELSAKHLKQFGDNANISYVPFYENQIKLVSNKKPTKSNRINEDMLQEVYPKKNETKKDFISRFMSVTKDEYPNEKQRYAVALSYWDRRNKKVNEELINENDRTYYFTSPFEVKNYLLSQNKPQRILIDKKLNMYLVGDANETIHTTMINDAKREAIVGQYYYLDDYNKNQVALVFYPKSYRWPSEEDFDLDYAINDNYDYKYVYNDFIIYSRYQDFDDFELSNILGKHKKIKVKLINPNGYTMEDRYRFVEDLDENNNYGYHAGDLGKSEQRERQTGGRNTGHFGTGTYFVGNPDRINGYNDYQYGKGEAPHHIVDFSSYNLYKPSTNDYGYKLHDALANINNGYKYFTKNAKDYDYFIDKGINGDNSGDFRIEDIPEIVEHLNNLLGSYNHIDLPTNINFNTIEQEEEDYSDKLYDELKPKYEGTMELFDAIEDELMKVDKFKSLRQLVKEVRECIEDELTPNIIRRYKEHNNLISQLVIALEGRHSREQIIQALNEVNKHLDDKEGDSLSTIFMKALGYEGVDTRHLQDDGNWAGLDNTTYGSVIYDLKPETIVEDIDNSKLECYNSNRGDNMRLTEEQLNEMARVGQILDKYEIYVYSGEGFIPHFHLFDKTTKGDKFHSCIRIDECSYFDHEGKNDKLNNKIKKALVDFLESKPNTTKGNFLDYWDVIVFLWNLSNPGKEIDENIEMPNYYEL